MTGLRGPLEDGGLVAAIPSPTPKGNVGKEGQAGRESGGGKNLHILFTSSSRVEKQKEGCNGAVVVGGFLMVLRKGGLPAANLARVG